MSQPHRAKTLEEMNVVAARLTWSTGTGSPAASVARSAAAVGLRSSSSARGLTVLSTSRPARGWQGESHAVRAAHTLSRGPLFKGGGLPSNAKAHGPSWKAPRVCRWQLAFLLLRRSLTLGRVKHLGVLPGLIGVRLLHLLQEQAERDTARTAAPAVSALLARTRRNERPPAVRVGSAPFG